MKKFFSLIAAVLFAGSMMADSYTIEFKDSGSTSDSNNGLTSTTISDYVATGADYISAIAATGKVYNAQQGWGLKFGNSSNPGTVTLTLATPVKPTSIAITASQYGATEGSALLQDSVIDLTAGGGKGEFNDYTYEYDGNTEVTTIIIGTSAKRAYVKSVTVNYEAGPAPAVATPVIAGDAEFTDSVIVTITCSTPETDIYYTTDGTTDPKCDCAAAPEYKHEIVLKETTTIKAAAYTGNDWSAVAEKTFTKKEKAQPITCAEVYSKTKNDEVALNDVVVTYANGKNVYVKDATGAMLVYLTANTSWNAGDVLSGIAGTVDIYNNLYEVKPTADQVAAVTATPGEAPAPEELTKAPVAGEMNKFVLLKNVTVSAETFPSNKNMNCTIGDETFVLRNNFNADVAFDTLKTYDITGVVAVYNATVQVYFINAEEVKDAPVEDWSEIVFTEAITADDLAENAIFKSDKEGFEAQISDSGNKMSIDANPCRFGTAEGYNKYDFRLKSGGASGSDKNFITVSIPAKGKFGIAPRTASGSATDRELILIQDGDTLFRGIVEEAQAIEVREDSNTVKVYPFIEVPVEAGSVIVRYTAALNFYAFGFNGTLAPEPDPEYFVIGSMTGWEVKPEFKLEANPEAEGEFRGEFIFQAGDEFKVVKNQKEAWYPDGVNNNYQITEGGEYIVHFRPDGQGGEGWHEGYINAELKETPIVEPITCAEVYGLEKGTEVLLREVVVTFVNAKSVWVKDNTASMLIYFAENSTLKAGDRLQNVAGAVDIYNGVTEVKPSADQAALIVAYEGPAPKPENVETVTLDDVNRYILIPEVELDGEFVEGTQSNIDMILGEDTVTLRNQFKLGFTFEADKAYDIIGVVTLYKGKPQVYFTEAKEYVAPDTVQLDLKYIDAYRGYGQWSLLFYNEYFDPFVPQPEITYPLLQTGLKAKSETTLAGTYNFSKDEDREFRFAELLLDSTSSISVDDMSDMVITYLGEGLYHFDLALLCSNNTIYVLCADLKPRAIDMQTKEEIELTDPEPEGLDNTNMESKAVKTIINGQLIIEKSGVRYNVLGIRL